MSEERLREIKDSVEFQYTLAKAKGYDNALLFTNEEEELIEEIERLHSIIKRLEKELFGMYVDIAGWDEDYAKKLIKKIEDSSQECELLKNNKKDVSIKSDELKCQFSDIWEYGDR